MDLSAKKDRLRQLANVEFPAAARAGNYPIRLNHCFLRVVYDTLFEDKWDRVLSKSKPAIHQLSESLLDGAIEVGEAMVADKVLTEKLNEASLRYRGKLKE